MKKMILLGVGLLATAGAMAQKEAVTSADRMLKGSNPNYVAALNEIQPALSNPETSGQMITWYTAGKAAFGVFDDAFKKLTVGQQPSPEEMKQAGQALCDGFDYYMKALELDSLPDEKGKVKPKKSGEILKTLKATHPKLNLAAGFLFDTQDYDNAYRALDLFVEAPSYPQLVKNPPVELADSVRGQMYLAEAQALLLSDQANHDAAKVQKALEIVELIPATGYESENTYKFALIAASSLGNKEAKTRWAKAAFQKYGASDVQYIGELINDELDSENYPAALALVDQALGVVASDNNEILSQLYNIRGIINSRDNKFADAKADLEKALSYSPENYEAMYRYGLAILADIEAQQNANENLLTSTFKDDMLKAAGMLEKAFNHDEDKYSSAAYTLYSVYYNLGKDYVEQAKYWEALK